MSYFAFVSLLQVCVTAWTGTYYFFKKPIRVLVLIGGGGGVFNLTCYDLFKIELIHYQFKTFSHYL